MSEDTSTEEQATPATAEEAWDAAVDALTPEQLSEWREARVHAARAGFDAPNPPGYRPPAPAEPSEMDEAIREQQEAARVTDLEQEISDASQAGDWDKSRALKHQLTDIYNRRRLASANGGARFYGRDGR